jgi:hypothetical protein
MPQHWNLFSYLLHRNSFKVVISLLDTLIVAVVPKPPANHFRDDDEDDDEELVKFFHNIF